MTETSEATNLTPQMIIPPGWAWIPVQGNRRTTVQKLFHKAWEAAPRDSIGPFIHRLEEAMIEVLDEVSGAGGIAVVMPIGVPWQVPVSASNAHAYSNSVKEWLQTVLEGLVQNLGPAENRFVYFANPNAILNFVSLYEIPSQEESVEDLLGMGDAACIRPPKAVRFESGSMDDGMKSLRFVTGASDRDITGIAHWVWRQDDSDIIMIAGGQNVAEFGMLQDEFDEFARSISVIDATFHFASSEA